MRASTTIAIPSAGTELQRLRAAVPQDAASPCCDMVVDSCKLIVFFISSSCRKVLCGWLLRAAVVLDKGVSQKSVLSAALHTNVCIFKGDRVARHVCCGF
jgi:hypothetical protein